MPDLDFKELMNLSPPVALLVFLYVFGIVLRKSEFFPNRWLPLTQVILGASIYPALSNAVPVGYYHPLVTQIFWGALIGGGTVCANQTIRQFLLKRGITMPGDTEITRKDDEKKNP